MIMSTRIAYITLYQKHSPTTTELCRKKNHRKSEKTFYFFYYDKKKKENITNKWHAKDKDEREKSFFFSSFCSTDEEYMRKTIESKKYAMV